jgi:hypothetical protein
MIECPTELSSIVWDIANVRGIIRTLQDDDDTDWGIRNDESEDSGKSRVSSNIEEHNLDNRRGVLHPHEAR